MRNVLVVLVLSCIGLSCGFIVPSGIREIIADLNISENSIENSDSKSRNMIKSKTVNSSFANITVTSEFETTSFETNHNTGNNSLDNDLFENSNGKDATIEERSFIYIKQRGKTPYLKNVFELIPKTNYESKAIKSYVISHPIIDDISRRFLTENIDNRFSNKHVGQTNYDDFQLKVNNLINENIESIPKISNKHGELMKSPIVRPVVKTNEKDFISMENSLFNFTIGRKLLKDIQENVSNKSSIKLKNNAQLETKITDMFNDKVLTTSDEALDDDNLDQIIRKLLENQILERKSNHVDHNGFHFCRDCLKKAKKQTLNNRLQIESNCKCRRKKLLKNDDIGN